MWAEEHKAVVRRVWQEVVVRGNLDVIDEIFAPDALWYLPRQEIWGRDDFKQGLTQVRESLYVRDVDVTIAIEDQVAEGDKVSTRYTLRATLQEFNPSPERRIVEIPGITISRIVGGKINEEWASYDTESVREHFGFLPGDPTTRPPPDL